MSKLSIEEIQNRIGSINPNIKILERDSIDYTIFKIKDLITGFNHKIQYKALFSKLNLTICSAEDKNAYFQTILNKKFSNITLISDFITYHKKVIVLGEEGLLYEVVPHTLRAGLMPSIQSALDKNKCFAIKANKIHNFRYNYELVNYINARTKIIIVCPIHGEFTQLPLSHLAGYNCPKCFDAFGWTRTQWFKICDKHKSNPCVYIIRCYNKEENFIKIGMTSQKIYTRFKDKNKMPYSYEVLKEIKGSSDFVFDKEKELHKLCKKYKYKPVIYFAGETECFTLDCLSLLNIQT